MVVGSTNDLKPASLICVRRKAGLLREGVARDGSPACGRRQGTAAARTRGRRRSVARKRGIIAETTLAPHRAALARNGSAASDRHGARRQPTLLDGVAGDLARGPGPAGRSAGLSRRQRSLACGQRGWNVQPGGGSSGLGTSPATAVRASPVISRSGTASSSMRVYGCCGLAKSSRVGRDLDDAAEVHHADAVGDVVHDREVVRDEEVREPELALQVAHQVQHLRLHRHVERGRRLVADQERGLGRQRARDRDALPLAARELVRILDAVGGREADLLEQRATRASSSRAQRRRACARIGSATMSATRQRGLRLAYGSWKIICMPRRAAAQRARIGASRPRRRSATPS